MRTPAMSQHLKNVKFKDTKALRPFSDLTHSMLIYAMAEGLFAGEKNISAGPDPPNHLDKLVPSRISSVFDRVPIGLTMGSCVQEPNATATHSVGQLVLVKFGSSFLKFY
jgi:hypothetical protein